MKLVHTCGTVGEKGVRTMADSQIESEKFGTVNGTVRGRAGDYMLDNSGRGVVTRDIDSCANAVARGVGRINHAAVGVGEK